VSARRESAVSVTAEDGMETDALLLSDRSGTGHAHAPSSAIPSRSFYHEFGESLCAGEDRPVAARMLRLVQCRIGRAKECLRSRTVRRKARGAS